MKLFISVLVLIFSLQSWTKAEDISDFEIEGMSIGDSVLDYYTINKIKDSRKYKYKSKKFYSFDIWDNELKLFDSIQFHVKKKDKQYKIYGLSGAIIFGEAAIYYPNSENECKKQKEIIENDIDDIFSNAQKKTASFVGQKGVDKKAIRHETYYILDSGEIYLQCVTWGKKAKKKNNVVDNLRLTILNNEFANWMNTEAY